VVSIFVNPTQFAPHEDFESYPRDEAGDRKKLAEAGADLIYAPALKEMYPPGFATRVQVGGVAEGLEGGSRPHFFGGVATIVSKLLIQCRPDVALFGEKDYQQLKVIQQMARDLDLPVTIIGCPIVREEDGLAMSSRNAYLRPEERIIAPLLYRTIADVASDIAEERPPEEAVAAGRARLSAAGFAVDYLEVRGAKSLAPLAIAEGEPARVLAAAYLGRTRLIDNVPVPRKRKRRRA
jgi:pantoate--beta-alanine ligase